MLQQLIQDTEEWHNFRRTRTGASDAPAIMQEDPWTTAYQLFQRKLSGEKSIQTEAMKWGKMHEEKARNFFERELGMSFEPCVKIHQNHDFIFASLDGWNEEKQCFIEIKCPRSFSLLDDMRNGIIPKNYDIQTQQQFECSQAKGGFFCAAYFDTEGKMFDYEIKELKRKDDLIKDIIQADCAFYECLRTGNPPPLTDRDFVNKDDYFWNDAAENYLNAKEVRKSWEQKEEFFKNQLVSMCEGKNCVGNGVRVQRVISKGRIDYEKAINELDLDLEKYRKSPIESWRIT